MAPFLKLKDYVIFLLITWKPKAIRGPGACDIAPSVRLVPLHNCREDAGGSLDSLKELVLFARTNNYSGHKLDYFFTGDLHHFSFQMRPIKSLTYEYSILFLTENQKKLVPALLLQFLQVIEKWNLFRALHNKKS
jgi:hypothetical protein